MFCVNVLKMEYLMQIQYKEDDLPFFIIVIIIKREYNNSMNFYLFRLAKKSIII